MCICIVLGTDNLSGCKLFIGAKVYIFNIG